MCGLAFVQGSLVLFSFFDYPACRLLRAPSPSLIYANANDVVTTAHPNVKPASSPPKLHPPTPPLPQHPQSQSLLPSRLSSHLQPRTPSKDCKPFAHQPSDVPPPRTGGPIVIQHVPIYTHTYRLISLKSYRTSAESYAQPIPLAQQGYR